MAHSHYMMGLYYAEDGNTDAPRREILRIATTDDTEAVNEASRISGWRQPIRHEVRAITKAARAGDRLVHGSVAELALRDDVQPATGSTSAGGALDPPAQWDRLK